jgi:hypothetical protein
MSRRKLHSERLHSLHSSPDIISVIKYKTKRWAEEICLEQRISTSDARGILDILIWGGSQYNWNI